MIYGLMILHYGKDYIGYSASSVLDHVNKLFIFYTEKPSHGHSTDLKCPESETDLLHGLSAVVKGEQLRKVEWIKKEWSNEGQHRNEIFKIAKPDDIIVVVDSDEVWNQDALRIGIEQVSSHGHNCRMRFPFVHYWRSFDYVCYEPCLPVRIMRGEANGQDCYYSGVTPAVHHFGYCQSEELIKYKISIHGHKNEIFPHWFEEKFLKWSPENLLKDTHPTCTLPGDGWWCPKKRDVELPAYLHNHPYKNLKIIK